jgi:hypothetical protein
MAKRRLLVSLLLLLVATAASAARPDEKAHEIDSGVFAVLVNGQEVATETFRIEQGSSYSTVTSEFRTETPTAKSAFRSVLQILPSGELKHYEWHELAPGKAQLTVDPAEGLLNERIQPNPPAKPTVQPLLLPLSTLVLDDYVFSHRQVLAWKYLSQACGAALKDCRPTRADFGVLVPQQRSSVLVTVEYAGTEKVTLHGVERQLNRIDLKADDMNWSLWLDGDLKVMRILIPSEKTEVVRK